MGPLFGFTDFQPREEWSLVKYMERYWKWELAEVFVGSM